MSIVNASQISQSVRDAFNFSVDKFPLFGPDNMKTDQYGLFRSDSGYIEGIKSISSRYTPHSTDDVCALVEACAEAFDGEVECQTLWQKGHYVKIQPTREQRVSIFGQDDNIWPRVIISGGFDGKGFKGTVGYWRDLCDNCSMMRRVNGITESIPHFSNLRDKMDDLIQTFAQLKNGWSAIVERAQDMQSRRVTLSSFLREVYADRLPSPEQIAVVEAGGSCRAVTTINDLMSTIFNRVLDERKRSNRRALASVEAEISGWEAYNAVQGYVQHAAQAKKGFTSDFSRIIRAANDKHVKRAEDLVLSA